MNSTEVGTTFGVDLTRIEVAVAFREGIEGVDFNEIEEAAILEEEEVVVKEDTEVVGVDTEEAEAIEEEVDTEETGVDTGEAEVIEEEEVDLIETDEFFN